MLANSKAEFVFFHIPKNAGTTIREQFRAYDDFDSRFDQTHEHPVLGTYDANHVPPAVLREVFPEDFAHILPLDKFAILRDPFERFESSLGQRIRMFSDKSPQELSPAEIEKELIGVIDYMTGLNGMPRRDFAHFMRQVDFVRLDGARFVDNLFTIDDTENVAIELAGRLDIEIEVNEPENSTNWSNKDRVVSTIQKARGVYRRVLPARTIRVIRKGIESLIPDNGPPPKYRKLFDTPMVHDFIEDYYADDIEMFSEVVARNQCDLAK
jgi:hypothetical protein